MNVSRSLALSLALVLPVLVGGTGSVGAASPNKPDTGRPTDAGHGPHQRDLPCFEPLHTVKGQGPSCHVANGLFKVKLHDGTFTYTHGPDAVRPHQDDSNNGAAPGASGQTGNLGTITPRNPVCTSSNPHGAYGFRAIIALPSDGMQTITTTDFRTMLQQIDGAFYKSAVESGSANGADLVFDCDSTGAIAVDVVRLGTTTANSTFASIVSDLKKAGYTSTARNYAVFFTARMAAGGQGTLLADSTNSAANLNNTGGRFAIDYGVNAAETMLHEIGHNLGAVQPGAPYATGSATTTSKGNWGHCWEGKDVMCYNDGGSSDAGSISWVCTDFDHFDCGHDDYFDAVIGAGQGSTSTSWLASHFNIGACYDVLIVNRACTAAVDSTPPAISTPTQTIQYLGQITGGLVPVTYTWGATDTSGIAQYEVWISTNGSFYQQTISSATATSGTWTLAPGSTYQMAVRAKDRAGNWSGFANGPTFVVDAFQESAITDISTGWTSFSGSYFGGRQYSSAVAGSWASLTFTGRGFAWYAATASNRGEAYVWVDGTYIGSTVDTSSTTLALARAVMTRNWSTSAQHTVTLQVVGTANRPTIDLDAFVVLR